MNLDTLSQALWLILLALIVVVGLFILLARRWEQAAEQDLKDLRSALRQFQSGRKQVEAAAGAYTENDPEPYRSQAAGLRRALTALARRAEQLERRQIVLRQRALDLKQKRWQTFFGLPQGWLRLRREIAAARAELDQTVALMDQTAGLEQALENLSWETALRIRQFHQDLNRASQILSELRAQNLHGEAFELALRQEKGLQVALSQVPRPYLEADQAELRQQESKEATARVYEIVRLNLVPLQELLERSRAWKVQIQAAQESVGRMRRALGELEGALSASPENLDVSEEAGQRRQLEVIGQNLQATLSRLEAESLLLVASEAERVRQTAQEIVQRLAQARRELDLLERSQSELMEGFRQLSLLLATFGAKSSHPVNWETSLEQLAQLNRQANSLINLRQPRTPAAVSADLASLARLSAEQKALARHCEAVGLAHTDLLSLLESPEMVQLPKWLQTARQLVTKASEYGTENWSRLLSPASLSAEVENLAEASQRLAAGERSEPISELELQGYLEETRQLLQNYRQLAARLEELRLRLDELQRSEELARERLEELGSTLKQAQRILNSNPFLAEMASKESDQLLEAIQKAQSDLADRQRLSVEKKARQCGELIARAETSVNRWLEQMAKENREQIRELTEALGELDAIAPLDDPAVAQARQVLSSEGRRASEATAGRSRLKLGETVLELKRLSDFWQECRAAQNALGGLHQLVESYQEASFQRDKVRQLLQPTSLQRRAKRSWPPSSLSPQAELRELETIDQQWDSLKAQGGRAIWLVAQYSGISNRYQALAEKARQNAQRAAQEQEQVEQWETSIAERVELWQGLLSQHRDNPLASQELRDLLDAVEQELNRIRREYLQSALAYPEVIQALKALERRVRFFQVALDDEHALDSSGQVIRRRHSERE